MSAARLIAAALMLPTLMLAVIIAVLLLIRHKRRSRNSRTLRVRSTPVRRPTPGLPDGACNRER